MYFSNSLFSNFFSRSLNHFQPLCCALSLRCPYSFLAIISCIIYLKLSALPKYLSSNNTLFIIKQHVVYHKTTRCLPQNDTLFIIKRHVVYYKTSRRFDNIHPPRPPPHLSLTIENNYWFYQGFLSRARTHNKSFCFFTVTSVTTHHTTISVSRNKSTIKTSFNKHTSIQLFRGVFTFRFSSFSPNFVLALFPHFPPSCDTCDSKKVKLV